MKKIFVFIATAALIISSCQDPKKSDEYQRLQAENDSLKAVGSRQSNEYNEMLSLINEVEDNFRKIKETENYLTEQSQAGGELSKSTKERITNDMQLLTETLKKNKEQIQKLQQQMKSSGLKSTELQKRLDALVTEVDEKTKSIASLQEQLEKQNIIIAEQGQKIQEQSTAIDQQKTAIDQQTQQISAQDKSLNTGFYVFGTKKELEEEKILVKGKVMQQGYNHDYFTKVDIRNLNQIPLYSKKAKILTTHPASSFTLEKAVDGNLTVTILNKKDFWSISKYLVVQVD